MKLKIINSKNQKDCQEHLLSVISSRAFLNNDGLNNEVPFHICPYQPSIQNDISLIIKQLQNELGDNNIKVLEINLFDLVIELLKREGDWEWILENESILSKDRLKEELQGILDIETIITPEIAQRMSANRFEVLFLTGIGEVYPYIRTHNVLNNLQKKAKDKPTLIFFPGEYRHSVEKGASLLLFGTLPHDNYYRAFNILDRAV